MVSTLPSFQIRDCKWLGGVDWPNPERKFRSLPMKGPFDPDADQVPEIEKQSRIELGLLGISDDLLESHIERGARSHIIGTYRILNHRFVLTYLILVQLFIYWTN